MTFDPLAVIFEANPHAGLPPSEQAFRRRVDECAAWVAGHDGVLPTRASSDPEEKRHGQFLANQRKAKNGRSKYIWDTRRQAYLDVCIPGWEDPLFAAFARNVDECVTWVSIHDGALPSKTSTDPAERRHGKFLDGQRQARNGTKGVWDARRRAYLDERIPGWEDPFFAAFSRNVNECVAWIAAHHGALPNMKSTDSVEKRHGNFLCNQRQAKNGTGDDRRQSYLDEHVPGWEDPLFAAFARNAENCAAWIADHDGLLPNRRSSDLDEKRHGRFLADQRSAKKGQGTCVWDDRRQAYLDEHIPGWDDPRTYRRRRDPR